MKAFCKWACIALLALSVVPTPAWSITKTLVDTDSAQSVANKSINGTYNVKAYGALGNGSADDATSIQSAIDAAMAVSGTVLIPVGTYKLSSGLTIPETVTVEGQGWGSVLKVDAAASRFIPILVQGTAFAAVNGVVLRDFKVDGSLKGQLDAGLIQMNNAVGFLIDHVWIVDAGTPGEASPAGVDGISVSAGSLGEVGSQGTISNCLIEDTTKTPINWSTESASGLFYGNIVRNGTGNDSTPGIQILGGYNIKAIGNTVYGFQGPGIFVGTSGGVGTYRHPRYALIANNHVFNNGQGSVSGAGILVANAAASASQFGRIVVQGNVVYENGVNVDADGIHIQNVDNVLVEGNYVYSNPLSGIKVEASQNVKVSNNVLESNNTANASNVSGVYLQPAASSTMGAIEVSNNKMYNGASQHQKFPVYYDNSAAQSVSDVVIRDNDASGHESSNSILFDYAFPQRLQLRHRVKGQATANGTPVNAFYGILRDNSAAVFSMRTVAVKDDGSDRAGYHRTGLFYRDGGVATLQGSLATTIAEESDATWNQTLAVTGNFIVGELTGKAATNITWDSLIEVQAE